MKSPRISRFVSIFAFVAVALSFTQMVDARPQTRGGGVNVQRTESWNVVKRTKGSTSVNGHGVVVQEKGVFSSPKGYFRGSRTVDSHGVVVDKGSRFAPVETTKKVVRAPFNFVFGD